MHCLCCSLLLLMVIQWHLSADRDYCWSDELTARIWRLLIEQYFRNTARRWKSGTFRIEMWRIPEKINGVWSDEESLQSDGIMMNITTLNFHRTCVYKNGRISGGTCIYEISLKQQWQDLMRKDGFLRRLKSDHPHRWIKISAVMHLKEYTDAGSGLEKSRQQAAKMWKEHCSLLLCQRRFMWIGRGYLIGGDLGDGGCQITWASVDDGW